MSVKQATKSFMKKSVTRNLGTAVNGVLESVTQRYPPSCLKKADVNICSSVWQQYKSLGYKRYKDIPDHGVSLTATYFDSLPVVSSPLKDSSQTPTILLIHGSPGSVDHFSSLIDCMTEKGVRVVCPFLPHPDFTFKKCKYYRHSPPEKADFVKAILSEERVKNLSCVVSHSSGTFVNLALNSDPHAPEIKTLALTHILGDELITPMKPYWFTRGTVKWSQNDLLRKTLLNHAVVPLMKAMGNPFAKNGLGEVLWGGFSMHYYDRIKIVESLKKVAHQKKPTVIVMADNDGVIPKSMNRRLIQKCFDFDTETEADVYDKENRLLTRGQVRKGNEYLQVIRCQSGGHFAFIRNDKAVNQSILRLVNEASHKLADNPCHKRSAVAAEA